MDGWYNQSQRLPVRDRVKTKNEGRPLGEMDGWYNHSQKIPVCDRVKTKNVGSRATIAGDYWVISQPENTCVG